MEGDLESKEQLGRRLSPDAIVDFMLVRDANERPELRQERLILMRSLPDQVRDFIRARAYNFAPEDFELRGRVTAGYLDMVSSLETNDTLSQLESVNAYEPGAFVSEVLEEDNSEAMGVEPQMAETKKRWRPHLPRRRAKQETDDRKFRIASLGSAALIFAKPWHSGHKRTPDSQNY